MSIQPIFRMRSFIALLLLALAAPAVSRAQDDAPDPQPAPPPAAAPKFSAAELEKLAEPIALYPDPLIASILPASVYPIEVVQAARFVRNTNNIPKLDEQPWDENVKAVATIPQVIEKMDTDLQWTTDLGQAFLEQQQELMNAIQVLRGKAQSIGALQTTPQQIVVVTNTIIEKTIEQQVVVVTNTIVQIQPVNPQVIYVPTYPPTVYYPPPGYVYNPLAPLVTFGVGVAVGAIIANNCDWHHGGVYVGHGGVAVWGGGGGGYYGGSHGNVNVNVNNNNFNNVNVNHNNNNNLNANQSGGQKWQPDQARLQKSGAPNSLANSSARGWSSGATRPTPTTARPSTGSGSSSSWGGGGTSAASRPSSTQNFSKPSNTSARPTSSPSMSRPSSSSTTARSAPSSSGRSAFGGMSNGASTRSSSSRGSFSRGGGGRR